MPAAGPVEEQILRELAPTFAVREAEVGGASLRWLEGGEGTPVVLLHGRGNAATTWFPILADLASRHRVVAIDLPGFGASGAPPSPRRHDAASAIAFFAAPVEALLVREGLHDAAIVGHSLGGRVAIELALRGVVAPPRLALIAPMGLGPHASFGARAFFRLGPERLARALGPRLFRRISPFPDTDVGRRLEALSYELYTARARVEADRAFLALSPILGPVPHLGERLRDVRAEVLLLWGQDDEALPSPIAIAASTLLPRAHLHIAPLGHSPHLEDPERMLPILLDFLAR